MLIRRRNSGAIDVALNWMTKNVDRSRALPSPRFCIRCWDEASRGTWTLNDDASWYFLGPKQSLAPSIGLLASPSRFAPPDWLLLLAYCDDDRIR